MKKLVSAQVNVPPLHPGSLGTISQRCPPEAMRPMFMLFFPSRNSWRQEFLVMHKCFPSDQKPGGTILGFWL